MATASYTRRRTASTRTSESFMLSHARKWYVQSNDIRVKTHDFCIDYILHAPDVQRDLVPRRHKVVGAVDVFRIQMATISCG